MVTELEYPELHDSLENIIITFVTYECLFI